MVGDGRRKKWNFFLLPSPTIVEESLGVGRKKRRTSTGISTFARQEENKPILEEAM